MTPVTSAPSATYTVQQTDSTQVNRVTIAKANSWGCLQPIIDCICSVVEKIFSCFCCKKIEQSPTPAFEERPGIEIESIPSDSEYAGIPPLSVIDFIVKGLEALRFGEELDEELLRNVLIEADSGREEHATDATLNQICNYMTGEGVTLAGHFKDFNNSAIDDVLPPSSLPQLIETEDLRTFMREARAALAELRVNPNEVGVRGICVESGCFQCSIIYDHNAKIYYFFDPLNKNKKCELKSFPDTESVLNALLSRMDSALSGSQYVIVKLMR